MIRNYTFFTTLVVALAGLSQSAQATTLFYQANLDGPSESPVNASPGTGFVFVTYDSTNHLLHVQATFTGLQGTSTASHIHSATAVAGTGTTGVATQVPTFSAFPLGVTSGSFDQVLDLTILASFNAAFVTANGGTAATAEAALSSGIATGNAYLNIHTTLFPAGEIRGFLAPSAVPEPATYQLLAVGGAMLFFGGRRLRR